MVDMPKIILSEGDPCTFFNFLVSRLYEGCDLSDVLPRGFRDHTARNGLGVQLSLVFLGDSGDDRAEAETPAAVGIITIYEQGFHQWYSREKQKWGYSCIDTGDKITWVTDTGEEFHEFRKHFFR